MQNPAVDDSAAVATEAANQPSGALALLSRAVVFLLVLTLAVVGSFVSTLMGTRAVYSPDVGIGAAFAVWIAVPIALLVGAIAAYALTRRAARGERHLYFLAMSIGLSALLGPIVVFILLHLV